MSLSFQIKARRMRARRLAATVCVLSMSVSACNLGGAAVCTDNHPLAGRVAALEALHTSAPSNEVRVLRSQYGYIARVTGANKQWIEANFAQSQLSPEIRWDATIHAGDAFPPTARSVQGALLASQLSATGEREALVPVRMQLDLRTNQSVTQTVSVLYQSNERSHEWLRDTPLEEIQFAFAIESIVYEDGSRANQALGLRY